MPAPATRPSESVASARLWQVADVPALSALVMAFLQEARTDAAPTQRAVDILLAHGVDAADRGDPCMVAVVDDAVVGFTFWLAYGASFPTRGVPCQALGTYVLPAYRRRGVATWLRRAAQAQAWTRGYTRIISTAYTHTAAASLRAAGFRDVGRILEVEGPSWHSPP